MEMMLGVDEAGRGPLAGPVAVGLVVVPKDFDVAREFPGVADSKALSAKKRERIFSLLEKRAHDRDLHFTVEFESAEIIDQVGITQSINRALSRGLKILAPDPSKVFLWLDGSLYAPNEYSQRTIIHGDSLIPLISLASIAAKVLRDQLMCEMAVLYPGYSFEKHKGYGTQAHYKALERFGLSPIHRHSFIHIATKFF